MKLDDYEFKGVPEELTDLKDDILTIINYGKYSHQVVTSAPTWTGRNGESVFYLAGGVTRWYYYVNNTWRNMEFSTSLVSSWITWSGTGAGAILDSFNVSSVTDRGVGDFEIVWDTDFKNGNYACGGGCKIASTGTAQGVMILDTAGNPATGTLRVRVRDLQINFDAADPTRMSVVATGDQ